MGRSCITAHWKRHARQLKSRYKKTMILNISPQSEVTAFFIVGVILRWNSLEYAVEWQRGLIISNNKGSG